MVISSNTGRVYRPKECERLILYLKDINLPKPDKWGTSQLIAFIQQVGMLLAFVMKIKHKLARSYVRNYLAEMTLKRNEVTFSWVFTLPSVKNRLLRNLFV